MHNKTKALPDNVTYSMHTDNPRILIWEQMAA